MIVKNIFFQQKEYSSSFNENISKSLKNQEKENENKFDSIFRIELEKQKNKPIA